MGRQNRQRKRQVALAATVKKTELVVETTVAAPSAGTTTTTTLAVATSEEDERFKANREETYWKLREELMKRGFDGGRSKMNHRASSTCASPGSTGCANVCIC